VAFTCAAFLKVSVPDSPASCLGQGIAARQQEKPGTFSTSNRWLDDAERVLLGPLPVQQRLDLLAALSRLHTRECAELLYRVSRDMRAGEDETPRFQEATVRAAAVNGLDRMAAGVLRSGIRRSLSGPGFKPAVSGLLPYLVAAASDGEEIVRFSAITGLANTGDPAAVAELRNRLEDTSPVIRFHAACFLTEYQDASGLPELQAFLRRSLESWPEVDHSRVEMLLASFERLAGKSLGDIPDSMSGDVRLADGGFIPARTLRYRELLLAWASWWNSHPAAASERAP